MNQFDFAPLYRSAIGFDRLARMLNNSMRNDSQPSYPPYNIEIAGENAYRITMAVAGFDRSEIEIEVEQDGLKVTGRKRPQETQPTYLHRGIAARDFSHRVPAGRARPRDGRLAQQWPARHRSGAGNSGSHEAAPHRHS